MNVVKWMLDRASDYEEKARELRRAAKQLEGVREEVVPDAVAAEIRMRGRSDGQPTIAQKVLSACETEFKSCHELAVELGWKTRKVSNTVVRLKQKGLLVAAPKDGKLVYKKR